MHAASVCAHSRVFVPTQMHDINLMHMLINAENRHLSSMLCASKPCDCCLPCSVLVSMIIYLLACCQGIACAVCSSTSSLVASRLDR